MLCLPPQCHPASQHLGRALGRWQIAWWRNEVLSSHWLCRRRWASLAASVAPWLAGWPCSLCGLAFALEVVGTLTGESSRLSRVCRRGASPLDEASDEPGGRGATKSELPVGCDTALGGYRPRTPLAHCDGRTQYASIWRRVGPPRVKERTAKLLQREMNNVPYGTTGHAPHSGVLPRELELLPSEQIARIGHFRDVASVK